MKLFPRRSRPSTGHPVDDDMLGELGARADLGLPRHWVHYLYVADEPTARAAADEVLSDGWDLDRVERVRDSQGWVVVAEQHDAVLSTDRVAAARRFFETLAEGCGGDYGGWKSSV
ncbi:MAG: ribonuclease E inhibitor RraB [Marmoricola sp.]